MQQQQIQVDENGFPEFEPVRLYDAPATILTQIFEGEGSLSRAVRTLVDQESLSPAERNSYTDKLKKAYGGNALTNTAIDVATNPLVWLLAMTSPIGRRQFAATGGKLLSGLAAMRQGTASSKAAVAIAQMLRIPGLTGLISSTETQAPAMFLQSMAGKLKKLHDKEAELLSASRGRLMQRLSQITGQRITDLDPSRSDLPILRELNLVAHYLESGHAGQGTVVNPRFVNTVVGKVQRVEQGAVVGTAEPMILPRSAIQQLEVSLPGLSGLDLKAGTRFKVGDITYQFADEGVLVNSPETIKQARAMFPRGAAERELVRYTGLEDEFSQGLHIVGFNESAIRRWAQHNGIEDEFFAYVQDVRKTREHFKRVMFGKTNPDGSVPDVFELDVDKVIRFYTQHQKNMGNPEALAEQVAMQELLGADFFKAIDNVLPTWVKREIRSGSHRVRREHVEDVLNKFLMPQLEAPYLPRNTSLVYKRDANGVPVRQGPTATDALLRRRDPGMTPEEVASIALPREKAELMYDPDDLQQLASIAERFRNPHFAGELQVIVPGSPVGGPTVPLRQYIDRTANVIAENIARRKSFSVLTMDHELAMRKYLRDAQATSILHSDLDPALRATLEAAIRTPAPKLRGAYNRSSVRFDEEKIRRQLEFLGIRPEDMRFMDPDAAVLTEGVVANPALVRIRQEITSIRRRLATEDATLTIREKRELGSRVHSLSNTLEDLSTSLELPDVALLSPQLNRRVSLGEALSVSLSRESLEVQEQFKKYLLPHMFGGAKTADLLPLRASQNLRSLSQKFVDSGVGKWLESSSDVGRNFIGELRKYSTATGYELDAAYRSGGLTGYIYATHLGFNAASAMWNALQPLQWASAWMGGREVLSAYGTALKQLGAYSAERISKHGFGPMDPLARRELWLKHVPLAGRATGGRDLLGLSDDIVSTLDAALISAPVGQKPSIGKYLTVDLPLKLFQKAEELNRIVVAEAGMKWYQRLARETGLRMTPDEVFDQVSTMQSLVNFNPNPTTQFRAFQQGFFSNPMMRMFLQYPLRSVSNILVSQQLGGGVREVGFGPLKFDAPAWFADTSRVLGMGAVTYEIGKNMLGLNLSAGLGGAALTQLPGQVALTGLPMPPVVDIPLKLSASILEQDRQAFQDVVFRLVPGGLALQKALGALPALPGGGNFGIIQSQYADWGNRNEQGMVPVYNSDGMLQGFDSPFSLVMRGIGADFKKHKSPQEATKFLLANRAQMVDLRRKYKDAVLGNNMSAAQAIEAEYRKRYGVPMTVKPGEWDRAVQMREVSVSERMLDTMPEEVRGMFQQTLQGPAYATAMGLPVGGLAQGETAKQRASIRAFSADVVNPAEGQ